jgi:hypothetical protein
LRDAALGMLLLPLNWDCFLRDDPPQYQAVQFSGGTSPTQRALGDLFDVQRYAPTR